MCLQASIKADLTTTEIDKTVGDGFSINQIIQFGLHIIHIFSINRNIFHHMKLKIEPSFKQKVQKNNKDSTVIIRRMKLNFSKLK